MKSNKIKIALSAKFSEIVRREFSEADLQTVTERNKQSDYAGCCATQDFCDANMLMEEAFINVMGRDPNTLNDEDCQLWSDAWDISKDSQFKN